MEAKRVAKTKVDLITGFLGAGKTTFIMRYAQRLAAQGVSFAVIENEFGTAGCDGAILKDIGLDVSELSGGCICCSLKVDFAHALVELSGRCERIIVEPSGIFAPADFFEVLNSPTVREVCEVGYVAAVVDPCGLSMPSADAAAVFSAQLESAGTVLLSKTDELSAKAIEAAVCRVRNEYGVVRGVQIQTKPWHTLADVDFDCIMQSGARSRGGLAVPVNHAAMFNSGTIVLKRVYTIALLQEKLQVVLNDTACGSVLRIKGIAPGADGGLLWVSGTPSGVTIVPIQGGLIGLNIIGERIARKRIQAILEG